MSFGAIIPPPTSAAQFSSATPFFQLTTQSGTVSARTIVNKYQIGAIIGTGSIIKLHASGPATLTSIISETWIGLVASSGNAYNFDGNQVQVTWAGSNSVTFAAGSANESDEISFTIDGTKAVLVAMNLAVNSREAYSNGNGSNFVAYIGTGASAAQAGTTLKSAGYSAASGRTDIINQILVAS